MTATLNLEICSTGRAAACGEIATYPFVVSVDE
jgi:hypothetical protein